MTQAAAVAGPAAVAEPLSNEPHVRLRPCTATDVPAVHDICAGVYGGGDYIPRKIESYVTRDDTLALAAEVDGRMDALGLGQKRDDELFLFGLRVREGAYQRGLGTLIMRALCTADWLRQLGGGVRWLVGATIPQNPASLRIFEKLGFTYSATVEVWPGYADLHAFEASIGWPQQQAAPDQRMVDSVPGLRECLDAACSTPGQALADWQPCASTSQLAQAVASIRRQQAAARAEAPGSGAAQEAAGPSDQWLPYCYVTMRVDCEWMATQLQQGHVWLLPRPAAASSSGYGEQEYAAAVVMRHSTHFRRRVAGVVAADGGAVDAALAWAASREPHFVAFVSRGSREQGPNIPLQGAPAAYHVCNYADSHHSTFVLFSKPAPTEQLPQGDAAPNAA